MSRWEGVISSAMLLRDECLGKPEEDKGDNDLDAFTRQKKKISRKIKKIREVIFSSRNINLQKQKQSLSFFFFLFFL